MKILCHVGPWCVQQYSQMAYEIDPNAKIVLISPFLKLDQTGMVLEYYKNLKSEFASDVESGFDQDDFIIRCRLLRSMSRNEALLHLHSMKEAVSKALDRENPNLVISEAIDQYPMDLLSYECKQRSIPFFGLTKTFVDGYFRITSRGEKGKKREVSKLEVNEVIKRLENLNYAPNWDELSASTSAKRYFVISKRVVANWARIPYFFLKRKLFNEPYNYHYWASQISSVENFHIFPKFWLGNKEWKKTARKTNKIKIYHPLQMYPESTIDYWCKCLDDIAYEDKLVNIINSMSERFHFLIKEHPGVIGGRGVKLYKLLSQLENVTFAPTEANSNELIEESDAILVWTGSVGFEAALRGKPVLTVCSPYYASGGKFKKINEHTKEVEILKHISNNSAELNYKDKFDLVADLLSGFRLGTYINNSSWSKLNMEHIEQASNIAKEINKELSEER